MKYFSMFSGVGGFEYGIEQATTTNGNQRWECIGFSEIDRYATAIYQHHYPTHKNYGDATKINPNDLPDFDLIVAGFPCQAFSIAGERMGFKDTRGTLFFEIARIAERKKPRFLLLENVKGLLNHDGGRTFTTILATLDELGYNVEWEVLNSKNFGVPQNRERVFIIGHLRGEPTNQIFPIGEGSKVCGEGFVEGEGLQCSSALTTNYRKGVHGQGETYINEIQRVGSIGEGSSISKQVYSTDGVSQTLNSGGGGWGAKTGLYVVPGKPDVVGMVEATCQKRAYETPKEINEFLRANKGNYTLEEIANAVNLPKTQVEHYFRTDESRAIPSPDTWKKLKELLLFDDTYDKEVMEFYEKEIEYEQTRRVYGLSVAPTLTSQNGQLIMGTLTEALGTRQGSSSEFLSSVDKIHQATGRIRRLTPTECERLQGFEDSWTRWGVDIDKGLIEISDGQRYKCLGNAVTTKVVQAIIEKMVEVGGMGV